MPVGEESHEPAHSTSSQFNGAMDESSGRGSKTQAHISSGVVMDIAAFKVGPSVVCDTDTTTLRAARARSSSIGAVDAISQKIQKGEHCAPKLNILL